MKTQFFVIGVNIYDLVQSKHVDYVNVFYF